MNLRALALGAVIGFLFALSPSCGGKPDCDGCLDDTGACVKARDVSANACGTGGAVCQVCAGGSSCVNGACVSPDGGAVVSPCKEPCPEGCCDPSGACQTGRSNSACGSGAVACEACGTGESCSQEGTTWQCANAAVGTACTDNAQCQTLLGQQGVCKKATSLSNTSYPDGYCTIGCDPQNPGCPGGSLCVGGPGIEIFGEGDAFCWDGCDPKSTAAAQCRTGYACYGLSQQDPTVGGCWLKPLPDPTGASGSAGAACLSDGGCPMPPYTAQCVQDALPDGGQAYPGGLCTTRFCDAVGELCGPDGVCANYFADRQDNPIPTCFRSCANVPGAAGVPDGGCRDGYACQPFANPDGGAFEEGFCAPTCEVDPSVCGASRTCATEGAFKGLCVLPDGGF